MKKRDPETQKLTGSKGCIFCVKPCQFNGLRVSQSSLNAPEDGKKDIKLNDCYNCNTYRIAMERFAALPSR
jgi:hypothetical protein